MALVTLTTDFGTTDPFVGIMKGVLTTRAPGVTVVDVTHGIPPQQVLVGALVLRAAAPYFPPGTIHVAVVDPGVGSARRPICVETATGVFVGPDNGLLSLATGTDPARRIVHLTDERVFLTPRSRTFHGRDVFAPVAAALATGTPPAALGVPVDSLECLSLPAVRMGDHLVHGEVMYVDHFGNLTTNISPETLANHGRLTFVAGSARIAGLATTYASVPAGHPVAVVNSFGLVEIAVREGSAAAVLGAGPGSTVTVEVGE